MIRIIARGARRAEVFLRENLILHLHHVGIITKDRFNGRSQADTNDVLGSVDAVEDVTSPSRAGATNCDSPFVICSGRKNGEAT